MMSHLIYPNEKSCSLDFFASTRACILHTYRIVAYVQLGWNSFSGGREQKSAVQRRVYIYKVDIKKLLGQIHGAK